jgi:hypothetical protein
MNVENCQNQKYISNGLVDFNVGSNFLMNFQTHPQQRKDPLNPLTCPQFSTAELNFLENRKNGSPVGQCTSLMMETGENNPNRRESPQRKPLIRNPFHNSEESEQGETPSLGGFLKGLNVSRISEDFPRTTYSTVPKTEVIRSMDFENISFEDKSRENFLSNNIFFDLCSQEKVKPIQKNSKKRRQELQMLISNKNKLSQSYVRPSPMPPLPIKSPMAQSVMVRDPTRDPLNPFKDLSFTSEKHFQDSETDPLRWDPLASNLNKNAFDGHFSMNKSSIRKNCFYESDEDSVKDTHTMASKITFSPSKNKYNFKRTNIDFYKKLKKIRESAQKVIPEMNMCLNRNESFLTQNKPNWSLPKILGSPKCNTISLYRADNPTMLNSNVFRSQSQRSLFSQNKEKYTPGTFIKKKKIQGTQLFGSLTKSKSSFLSTNKTHPKSFRYSQHKSANLLKIQKKDSLGNKERPFSPSEHSDSKSKFWPSHLEDRFLNMESPFTCGLEPFLSCLSPNSKSNQNYESILSKSKILKLNQKISNGLLNRNGSFDIDEGKELVSMFFDFISNSSSDSGRFIKGDSLKKIKQI